MKKSSKLVLVLLLIFGMFLIVYPLHTSADVGNFNDYDSDFDSDFDFGGGSDFDWDYSDSDGDFAFSLGGFGVPVLIIIILLALLSRKNVHRGTSGGASYGGAPRTYSPPPAVVDMTQSIETQIKETDPDFSSQKFLSWAEEVFMTLQDAWTKRDWKMIRPFECESLFNKHSKQLEEYIRNNTINVVERICINESMLTNYFKDNQFEYLTVYMKTRMNDYIIDADSKQVVKGDKDRVFYTNYNLKFMRTIGVKTTVNSGHSTTNCPNCGAPTQITSAGECEYCNSVITTGNHDWVLCDLDRAQ